LLRDIEDNNTEIRLGLSLLMKGDRPACVALVAHMTAWEHCARMRLILRTAREEKLNAVWSEVSQ
jgi:hypothetical protein